MLVKRNRNDCAGELTLTIWNRNLQLCSGSNPTSSAAPCKASPEHLCTRSARLSRIPTVLTWVGSASRTPCSFHAGCPLEAKSISLSPDLCKWGCTKTRTLLLAHSYLWQEPHLHLMELCFTTAVKNQHVPPILPGCSSSTPGAGCSNGVCLRQLPAPVIGRKTQQLSATSGCGSMCQEK